MKELGHYILKDKKPVLVTREEWLNQLSRIDLRRVAETRMKNGIYISTVFLGLDHNWSNYGPPLIFETMIFGGPHDQYQTRSSTWEEAEEHHRIAVAKAEEIFPLILFRLKSWIKPKKKK